MKDKEIIKVGLKYILLDYSVYQIVPIDVGLNTGFKKGVAYTHPKLKTVLPFRGDHDIDKELKPGIYNLKGGKIRMVFIKKSHPFYDNYNIKNIKTANTNIFSEGNFMKGDLVIDFEGDSFRPIINADDDINMKTIKTAFNLIDKPLSVFDRRFQYVDAGTSASSRKSNAKKSIMNHQSLSATKFQQLCDVIDLDFALTIRSKPNAVFPMNTDGRPVTFYSNGEFDLSNSLNIAYLDIHSEMGTEGDE